MQCVLVRLWVCRIVMDKVKVHKGWCYGTLYVGLMVTSRYLWVHGYGV
jgi:hypothetical protein